MLTQLKWVIVLALIVGVGIGTANAGLALRNAPTSTTTTTPHSMLNPEPQNKHIVMTKSHQDKNSMKTDAAKINQSGSSNEIPNTNKQ